MKSKFLINGTEYFGYVILLKHRAGVVGSHMCEIDFMELPDLMGDDVLVAWDRDGLNEFVTPELTRMQAFHNKGFINSPRLHNSDRQDAWYFYGEYRDDLGRQVEYATPEHAFARYLIKDKIFNLSTELYGMG